MNNLIDKKFIISSLIVLAIAFFARKWLTKTVKKADGTESSYVGHEAVGFA